MTRRDLGFEWSEHFDLVRNHDQDGPGRSEGRTRLNLNPTNILASLVGSGIGYVYFSYGRSQSEWPMVAAGLGLMTYSYFVTSVEGLVVIGTAIAVVPFAVRRFS